MTHRRTYIFELRGGGCVTGKIVSVAPDSVKIEKPDPSTLLRADVARVSIGEHPYDVVYSSRSSWLDIAAIAPRANTYFRVVTKDGKQHAGTVKADQSGITLSTNNKSETIRKPDVARVYYVRLKPLSDSARYSDEERFPLNPELWPYYLNIGVQMRVLLYDSSALEDDSKTVCSTGAK